MGKVHTAFGKQLALRSSSSSMAVALAMLLIQPTNVMAQSGTDLTKKDVVEPTLAADPTVVPAESAPSQTTQQDPNQSTSTTPDETTSAADIIVTGQRQALKTAQNIKKNAETFVDSITATDIGALPDKSVAESLQRVPGVTVNRFAASASFDTSHFSAEPSGVIVRGLPQVRGEYNGRDTFSANSSRGLSWGDITPELMAGIDVYKNQTADMIEGGIAGSINLRTRVPFDSQGQLIAFSAQTNYGDLVNKAGPEGSAFYSNRWQTGIGEVGILGNVAFSNTKTASQGAQYGGVGIFDNAFTGAPATVYIPTNAFFRDSRYERDRVGIAGAAQWRSNDNRLLATAQYNRSLYKSHYYERMFQTDFFGLDPNPQFRFTRDGPSSGSIPVPAPGTSFSFDDDGNFQNGTFTRGSQWWGGSDDTSGYGVNSLGQNIFNRCYAWAGCTTNPDQYGAVVSTNSRYDRNRNMTQDAALNLKFNATDRLSFNVDGQYVNSTVYDYDTTIGFSSFANVALDATGQTPKVSFSDPTNIRLSPGGLSNPNNYYLPYVLDHLEDSKGTEYAFRADVEYEFESNWLQSLRVGARYSDRDQTVQSSAYNWHSIGDTFSGNTGPFFNLDSRPFRTATTTFNGYPEGLYTVAPFGPSAFGGTIGTFPFVPESFFQYNRVTELNRTALGVGTEQTICTRDNESANSCFAPEEVATVSETTKAAYAMLRFGGENAKLGGLAIRGNLGVRYVETLDRSRGSLIYPNLTGYDRSACPSTPLVPGGLTGTGSPAVVNPGAPATAPFPSYCYLSASDLAFSSGGGNENVARAVHRNWLPSFNVRVDLSPKWLVRFAASKALARPDIGQLKNYTGLGIELPSTSDLTDSRWIKNSAGAVIGVNPRYTSSSFNPYLKPITAWQFDASIESYFANVGSFSAAIFYKSFDNYIQQGVFDVPVTRDEVTRTVLLSQPGNGKGAKIQGAEAAFQRFFTFLPKPFDGLGVQANFTYVDNRGVANSNVQASSAPGTSATPAVTLDAGELEGLSKYSYNIIGFYEKGPLGLRLAYNWRDRYLVTVRDCCIARPIWQEAQGWLDGSIRYAVRSNVEFNLSGSNLLNTKTVLLQQITDTSSPEGKIKLARNGTFRNDVRVTAGIRVRFGK